MNKMLIDKYFLLCCSIILIIIIIFISESEVIEDEDDLIGIIYNISETKNGYIFEFEDSQGKIMKCYYDENPLENKPYKIKGSFSEDGDIFFLDSMKIISLV